MPPAAEHAKPLVPLADWKIAPAGRVSRTWTNDARKHPSLPSTLASSKRTVHTHPTPDRDLATWSPRRLNENGQGSRNPCVKMQQHD
jgi:hypothetical protein